MQAASWLSWWIEASPLEEGMIFHGTNDNDLVHHALTVGSTEITAADAVPLCIPDPDAPGSCMITYMLPDWFGWRAR